MFFKLKKILFNSALNFTFFFLLLIGIQNSANKSRVNLYRIQTINLPISFIVGTSFVCGSLFGSLCNVIFFDQKKDEV